MLSSADHHNGGSSNNLHQNTSYWIYLIPNGELNFILDIKILSWRNDVSHGRSGLSGTMEATMTAVTTITSKKKKKGTRTKIPGRIRSNDRIGNDDSCGLHFFGFCCNLSFHFALFFPFRYLGLFYFSALRFWRDRFRLLWFPLCLCLFWQPW